MFKNLHDNSIVTSESSQSEQVPSSSHDHMSFSPDQLKQLCITVLKTHLNNYSENLVKKLTHKEEIKSPDKLKQLCLCKLRLLLPRYSDAEFETIRKTRKISVIEGINYPKCHNISEYLQKLSLTHKSCVHIPRVKKRSDPIMDNNSLESIGPLL